MFTQLTNMQIADVGATITALLGQLPSSPLYVPAVALNGVGGFIGYASYFLPIHEFVVFVGLLIPAILSYYVIRVALRWAKVAAD